MPRGTAIPRPAGPYTPTASAELVAWRRRALDQQLPAASFPAGSSAPSAVYLWTTLLIACAVVLVFAVHDERRVPAAVLDSQRDLVAKVARSTNLNATRAIADLDLVVAGLRRSPTTPPAQMLSRVISDGQAWTGASIVDTASRRPLAASGVPVPLDQLPPALPPDGTLAVSTPDFPALIRSITLDDSRTLLALYPLLMRNLRLNPEARHGVFMLTPDGKPILMQGVNSVAEGLLPTLFDGLHQVRSSTSRAIAVREWPDRHLVVSAAPVGETGVVVASMIISEVVPGTSIVRGLVLGASLFLAALLAFLLMRASLVHPVRALLRQAKADACGAQTQQRRSLHIAEAYRIAHALAVSSGAVGLRSARRRPTVLQGLTAAALVGLLWPATAALTTLGAPAPRVPAQLVHDEESRAEAVTAVLGAALDSGLATVTQIAQASDRSTPAQAAPALRLGLTDNHRLRALYLVDPAGKRLRTAGRPPLRPVGPLPGEAGLRLDPSTERLPVLYAYRVGAAGRAVVAEFDIDYLVGLMRQVDGRARVVDPELRTLLDSDGYRAFQPMTGATARAVAIDALAGGTVSRSRTPDGDATLVAGSALVDPPSVANLELVVVVERSIASLQLPEIISQRWTLLVAGAMVGVILLTHAWHYYIFVRPLRRLAAAADRICAGELDQPVPPQRHDDIGAVAMCLEICRQIWHTGSARFGGAIRLRGPEENFTAVLPRIPAQRDAARAGKG